MLETAQKKELRFLVEEVKGILEDNYKKKLKGFGKVEIDAMKDSVERQERGRDAVQDLRGVDRDGLLKQLRDNDDEH